ncbi:succinate dehydrogenase, cytochrome b556 subunit [Arenibacterium halophilum]|jgi:succinate dehydrogenase / fumarate reductase cytochrome b subunit|uniref:Succinate dehydrogenase cytochrome b556 subunit n=1 Tax=Arenibacterium halophilum TaxID=2583821 RepID=A0ABY2XF35_9RHOB|nr:succinate dehydrogenase, cytochrome b556 subunit [Arenibacterium halophilum]MAY88760.1 succinate dehydrogenase, cytochrome b556 subunit [Pseudooceanicola sp.]TMV15197.1 succinate dehydrogenase, cytochrome b556 subunit [Arenibacterium halophilum]|tara:strand:- start:543 stop:932 length:390 start_codon:yes stop_codon:yes gene_type:complete
MADVNRGNRPLSPFMLGQYYRPQMTSISSIMVRITGIASLGTAVLLVLWLLAAATSDGAFNVIDGILGSFIGDILMLLATWAIWYHVLGRLRHVIWDFGYAVELDISEKMGAIMFIGATVMAILTVIIV